MGGLEHYLLPLSPIELESTMNGPETRGVTVAVLAAIDLGREIEGLAGRQLRMRIVTIAPGGVFGPMHDHVARPGVVYVLQGTITDHRDGVATDYGPGVGWPEDRTTVHWLENRGEIPAVEVSVDIVGTEWVERSPRMAPGDRAAPGRIETSWGSGGAARPDGGLP